jgi:tetratricopeptide (TPR) repeat protein
LGGATALTSTENENATARQEALPSPSEEAGNDHQPSVRRRRERLVYEAIAAAWRAVELDPGSAEAWLQLGDLLFHDAGLPDEAEEAYRRTLERSPENPASHFRLGSLLLRLGRTPEALESLRRAAELAGSDGWLWSDLGAALAEGAALDEARVAVERAIGHEPGEPLHHYRLGEVLQKLGDTAGALSSFRTAAEAGPDIAWLQSHLGHALTEAGSYDPARVALDRAAALAPDDDLTRLRLDLLIKRREHEARRARRSKAAAQSSSDFPIAACIVLAAPRTGSTVLGHAVSEAWQADFLGEVFHDNPQDDFFGANFFRFRRGLLASDPSLSVPTWGNQRTIFRRYCQHVESISPSGAAILDVKYYSWHHLDQCFLLPHEPPTLIDFVRETSWPVIHLVRDNLFALYCSLKLSEQRGVWHRTSGTEMDIERPSLLVNVEACRLDLERLRSAKDIFDGWFEGYGNIHHLTYERLFDGDRFSLDVEETVARIFGEPPLRAMAPAMQKVTPPLIEVVENRAEVLLGLAGTPFHAMALEALA